MKTLKTLLVCTLVGGAASLSSAFNYNPGDLLLVFRQDSWDSGSGLYNGTDITFNLGTVSNFLSATSPMSVTSGWDYGTVTSTYGSLANVRYSLMACTDPLSSYRRVWMTDASGTAPQSMTYSAFSSLLGAVSSIGPNAAANSSSPGNYIASATATTSYTYLVSEGGAGDASTMAGASPFSVDMGLPGSMPFYVERMTASPTTLSQLGTFMLDGGGDLTYTPVPEPGSALLLGLGIAGLIRRRFQL
jgi:hypothetical protein